MFACQESGYFFSFILDSTTYHCKFPSIQEDYLGEVTVFLSGSDDEQLLNSFAIRSSSNQGNQNLLKKNRQNFS